MPRDLVVSSVDPLCSNSVASRVPCAKLLAYVIVLLTCFRVHLFDDVRATRDCQQPTLLRLSFDFPFSPMIFFFWPARLTKAEKNSYIVLSQQGHTG